jgi:hypothetical protein
MVHEEYVHVVVWVVFIAFTDFATKGILDLTSPGLPVVDGTGRCADAWVHENVSVLTSPYCDSGDYFKGVPSFPAFCRPTVPWHYVDYGGTACVCEKKWDSLLYASKLLRGFAFDVPHVTMPLNAYVLGGGLSVAYFVVTFTEILEEFYAGAGRWGFSVAKGVLDMEPRYDSLLRDSVLCAVPGYVAGFLVVSVLRNCRQSFLTGFVVHDLAVLLAYFGVTKWAEFATKPLAAIHRVNYHVLPALAGVAVSLLCVAHTCGRHVDFRVYFAWYLVHASYLIPQLYPLLDGLSTIYVSTAVILCVFAVYYHREGDPVSSGRREPLLSLFGPTPKRIVVDLSFSDIAEWISRARVGLLVTAALVCAVVGVNNFFVPPVPLDTVAYKRWWCGMGTLQETSDTVLGESACSFKIASDAAIR